MVYLSFSISNELFETARERLITEASELIARAWTVHCPKSVRDTEVEDGARGQRALEGMHGARARAITGRTVVAEHPDQQLGTAVVRDVPHCDGPAGEVVPGAVHDRVRRPRREVPDRPGHERTLQHERGTERRIKSSAQSQIQVRHCDRQAKIHQAGYTMSGDSTGNDSVIMAQIRIKID